MNRRMKLSFRIIIIVLLAVLVWVYLDLQNAIDEKGEEFRNRRLQTEADEQEEIQQRPETLGEGQPR